MMYRKSKLLMIFNSMIILFLGVSLAWVWVRAASTPLSTIGWRQVNESGFGSLQDISTLDTYKGQMYAGTWALNSMEPAQIWRSTDGIAWEQFSPGFTTNTQFIYDSQVFSNYLYIDPASVSGDIAEIWRSDGLNWESVASDGFGDGNNYGVYTLAVFSNTLIAATANDTSGVEIWDSPTGNAGSWKQVNSDGFGYGITGRESAMDSYDGHLYFGTNLNGIATLLRTDDLISWTPVFTDGLRNPNNTHVSSMAEFLGDFYIGLRNVSDGGEIWRTSNGVDFSPVFTGGYGNVDNQRPYGLVVYENYLYLVFSNLSTGTEVWRTSDGNSWQQVNNDGWGDANNSIADYYDRGATIFNSSLFIGTMNGITGGQIWQLLFSPDSVTISGPTSGELEHGYIYTGTVSPITTTLPMTYLWEATDYAPFTMTGGITETIIYNWANPGTKLITLTACNGAGTASNTYTVIIAPYKIYLPIIVR